MDWLASYHATVGCFQKSVNFSRVGQPAFHISRLRGSRKVMSIISTLRTMRLLKKGCTEYLVSLIGEEKRKPKLETRRDPSSVRVSRGVS